MIVVGLDGDDTLWHNERVFAEAEERVHALVAPWVGGVSVDRHLLDTERRNLPMFGYGVKSFTLSMIETAIALSDGRVPAGVIAEIIDAGKQMLAHPVELLDGVAEALPELAASYRVVLITKGDLFHQESKVARSGLLPYLDAVEIVSEKDETTFSRVLRRLGIAPAEFVMVGDSMRSDIAPVLALGGRAVHIPGYRVWELDRASIPPSDRWFSLANFGELPELLATLSASPEGAGAPSASPGGAVG
jgi:putative hydrolase of the HAD superfamily